MQGHTTTRARELQASHGANALPEAGGEALATRIARQFRSPLIYILLAALAINIVIWVREGAHGWPLDSLVIAAILLLNAMLGLWQEWKAEDALARLRDLSTPHAWVLRDGAWAHLPTREIVPGDQIRLAAGDRVSADGRLYGNPVSIDESILTGESLPVDKQPGEEAFSGTLIIRGQAYLDVTRTGASSALGRLAGMLGDIRQEPTPLERKLTDFGNRVARWILLAALVMLASGVASRGWHALPESLLFAVSLAVAAVPEGLPAVLSLALALGVERMAARKAIVRRLASVESLGSVTVIVTDKTGTLTENRMSIASVDTTDTRRLLQALTWAHEASGEAGDPEDLAVMRYTAEQGIKSEGRRVSIRPFDSAARFMRVSVETEAGVRSYLKGAPEALLERSDAAPAVKQDWRERAEALAGQGYRVLAVADAPGETDEHVEVVGLVSLWDPPRAEVPDAIRTARQAGVRVILATGDHPATARAIAENIGFTEVNVTTGDDLDRLPEDGWGERLRTTHVFARVRPEHKLKLVEQLRRQGEIVAMTGDGVNDAPALKRADIGIAMGQRGSDVTREVADLVLADDNFATVVAAIDEGRGIFSNIRKFVRFLFATNFSELVFICGGTLLAVALGLRDATGEYLLPITAVQILWINLVTDGLPALSLAFDRDRAAMKHKPRPPGEGLLDRASLLYILASGGFTAIVGLGLLGLSRLDSWDDAAARTAAFHFLALAQLFLVYPARRLGSTPAANRVVHLAWATGCVLQVAAASLTPMRTLLGITAMTPAAWAVVALALAATVGLTSGAVVILNRSGR